MYVFNIYWRKFKGQKRIVVQRYDYTTPKGVEEDINYFLKTNPESRLATVGKEGTVWYIFYKHEV
jgi:hypothetical protein